MVKKRSASGFGVNHLGYETLCICLINKFSTRRVHGQCIADELSIFYGEKSAATLVFQVGSAWSMKFIHLFNRLKVYSFVQ